MSSSTESATQDFASFSIDDCEELDGEKTSSSTKSTTHDFAVISADDCKELDAEKREANYKNALRVTLESPKKLRQSPHVPSIANFSISRFEKDFDKGECIGQGDFGKVYRCRSRIDKQDYAINEIRLKKDDTEEIEKQARECRSHNQLDDFNIVRYYDAWIEEISSPIPTRILYVKMEHYNCTLESYLEQRMSSADDISYNFKFETTVMESIIAAVKFLHMRGIVHCNINPSNIFIKTTKDDVNDTVLLGNFGLARQIPGYVSSKQSKPNKTTFPTHSTWSVKDKTLFSAPEQSSYNDRKPVDIYSAGVVFFDLFNYVKTENERYAMLNEFRNSHVVSENVCQKFKTVETLISMMCDKKAKRRPSILKVLTYYRYNIYDISAYPLGYEFLQDSPSEHEFPTHSTSDDDQDQDQFTIAKTSISLYEKNFLKGECIGQGGYGKVYECMSRVDKQDYAIKELRLKINDTEEIEKQLRECRHHAQLIHPNIVRYYDAWVENTSTPFPVNVLYIKMELCNQTLENYIDQRMASANNIYTSFFKTTAINSLFSAIEFLHLEGLMHRDIKPSNIFIKNSRSNFNDILLGDFGLARPVQQLALPTNPSDDVDVLASTNLSSSVGTFLYSAPELSSNHYDRKVDIYSAGIVVYDLVNKVKTRNDRRVMLNELRDSEAPSAEFYEKFPRLAPMIKSMLRSAKERPTIFELLECRITVG